MTFREYLFSRLVSDNYYISRDYQAMKASVEKKGGVSRTGKRLTILRLNIRYRLLHRESLDAKIEDTNAEKVETSTTESQRGLDKEIKGQGIYYIGKLSTEPPIDLDQLFQYDVISFDIYDTAIFRYVNQPKDIWKLLAVESGNPDYPVIRQRAEENVRWRKMAGAARTREVSIGEIYEEMSRMGIEWKWMEREIALEIELSFANPEILKTYRSLKQSGKIILFLSDMYLPSEVLRKILSAAGYDPQDRIIVSNEYGVNKGNGALQSRLLQDYKGRAIVHIGDNKNGDYIQSLRSGLSAVHYNHIGISSSWETGTLSESFYQALIRKHYFEYTSGIPMSDIYYEHGFHIGGILVYGFCCYLNKLAAEKHIDKILFCARDCEIIYRIYQRYFNHVESEYLQISRYAILSSSGSEMMYDLEGRFLTRYFNRYKDRKLIEQILADSGFDFLLPVVKEGGIDPAKKPGEVDIAMLNDVIFQASDIVERHFAESRVAAEKYYRELIGKAKNLLVVDVGWSGTCITKFASFINKYMPDLGCNISGALMCTSSAQNAVSANETGKIRAYIYSSLNNRDLMNLMQPRNVKAEQLDILHMPLEFLFTSFQAPLLQYSLNEEGKVEFIRAPFIMPENETEIRSMQQGMEAFVAEYHRIYSHWMREVGISPYDAFSPFAKALMNMDYIYQIFKNYTYDAFSQPYESDDNMIRFRELFVN